MIKIIKKTISKIIEKIIPIVPIIFATSPSFRPVVPSDLFPKIMAKIINIILFVIKPKILKTREIIPNFFVFF